MAHVIFISGCGGAGKDTTGALLLERLDRGALLDLDALIRVSPWEFAQPLRNLGIRNGAAVIRNFIEERYELIILLGGLTEEAELRLLEENLPDDTRISLIWLSVPKPLRDSRRIKRARDEGDKPQHLDQIDRVLTDPGQLNPRTGEYFRIEAETLSPSEVVTEVLKLIGVGSQAGV